MRSNQAPKATRAKTARRDRPATAPSAEGLNKKRVVAAALSLIDAQGIEAFSMRGLAQELGVYPTALYWHVPNRNALLAEVVSDALADVMPPGHADDWRVWLKDLFRRYRAAVRRHPNIAPLIGAQLVSNAGVSLELVDSILTVLASAGFKDELLVHAYNAVIAFKVGFVTLEFAPMPAEDADAWTIALKKSFRTVDPEAQPVLARTLPLMENRAFIVRWQNGTKVPLNESFEMYMDIAISGLEQKLLAQAE
jgi:TetR/AcrR family transcriptional regulator, tetracycline repressor protein